MLNLSKTESEAPVRGATKEEAAKRFIARDGKVIKTHSPAESRHDLMRLWWEFKRQEELAVTQRREIEEMLTADIPEQWEGSKTTTEGRFKVNVMRRFTRKVDGDLLQDIAREKGLMDHLSTLFRWKPEIDAKAWKLADEMVTKELAGAIVTTPGKPSFKIEEVA